MYQEILVYFILAAVLFFLVYRYLKNKKARKDNKNFCGDCTLKEMCNRSDKLHSTENTKKILKKDIKKNRCKSEVDQK